MSRREQFGYLSLKFRFRLMNRSLLHSWSLQATRACAVTRLSAAAVKNAKCRMPHQIMSMHVRQFLEIPGTSILPRSELRSRSQIVACESELPPIWAKLGSVRPAFLRTILDPVDTLIFFNMVGTYICELKIEGTVQSYQIRKLFCTRSFSAWV